MSQEEDTPFWRGIGSTPDDHFPIGLHHFPLIEAPDRGNLIRVLCCACRKRRQISGLELIRDFPDWLTRDACEWACTLRCEACGSQRLALSIANDPSAHGFRDGPHDTSEVIRMRRLLAWLPRGGLRLDDVAYLLRDVNHVHLSAARMPQEVVRLFSYGGHHCADYWPRSRLAAKRGE